jgi:hypothetical protein
MICRPLLFFYGLTIICNYCISDLYQDTRWRSDMYLPHACYMSIKSIVADLYWGLLFASPCDHENLYAMSEYITDLDPHFNVVYRYCALFLAYRSKQVPLALRLLHKSVYSAVNAHDWRIHLYIQLLSHGAQSVILLGAIDPSRESLRIFGRPDMPLYLNRQISA